MNKITDKLKSMLGQSSKTDCPTEETKRELYSIEINTYTSPKRYIAFCDDRWYETTDNSLPVYTKQEVDKIVTQLQKHYISPYKLTIKTLSGEQYVPQVEGLNLNRKAKKPLYLTTKEERKKMRDEINEKYASGFSFCLTSDMHR